MGFFDYLSFKARWEPEPGIEPASPQELYARLMGLNDQSVPWYIGDGRAEDADLIARWKFEDPYWSRFCAGPVSRTAS